MDVFVRDAQAGTTRRVSVSSSGAQAVGSDTGSVGPAISGNGRFVAFTSGASNLVPGDSDFLDDIFVRDLQNDSTSRVSLNSSEAPANDNSGNAAISRGGRYVAFDSFATNLVPNDTNAKRDVFVRDRQIGTTLRMSISSAGAQGNGFLGSSGPAISADGCCVAFVSDATNLVSDDTNGVEDIFVRDRRNGRTERVSVSSAEVQGDGDSLVSAISGDGRYVAFGSFATNLVSGDTNGAEDSFVRDRQNGTTERVSVSSAGQQGNPPPGSFLSGLAISRNGRFVAFTSEASNLAPNDTNAKRDVFVRDRQNGTTLRMSVSSAAAQGNGFLGSVDPAIGADGRFVAFCSDVANLVPSDTNDVADIFVRDRHPGRHRE